MPNSVIILVDSDPEALASGERLLRQTGHDFISSLELSEAFRYLAPDRPVRAVVLEAAQARLDRLVQVAQLTGQRIPFVILVPAGESRGVADALEAARWHDLVEIAAVVEKPIRAEDILGAISRTAKNPERQTSSLDPLPRSDTLSDGSMGEIIIEIEESDEDPTVVEQMDSLMPRELLLELYHRATEPPPASADSNPAELRMRATLLAHKLIAYLPRQVIAPSLPTTALSELLTRACELALAERDFGDVRETLERLSERPGERSSPILRPSLGGDLGALSVDQIIQLSSSMQGAVCLRIERDARSIEIFFHHSSIVFARQSNLREDFLIGRFIADTGAVSQHDVEEILRRGNGAQRRLGQELRARGWIQKEQLDEALERQTAELVYEALRWTSGRFDIYVHDRLPPEAVEADMRFPVQHLLLEGVRRLDEWRRITGQPALAGYDFPN